MKMAEFRQDEFEKFLQTILWLKECRIVWDGAGAFEVARCMGAPGEERIDTLTIEPGEEIDPIVIAEIIYSYVKDAYQLATGPDMGPGSAATLVHATLLQEQLRRGVQERQEKEDGQ